MEQLPDESPKAFAAFRAYAELGAKRSTTAVARTLSRSAPLIRRWSARYQWVKRAAAFDAGLERVASAAEEKELTTQAGLWAKRMQETREAAYIMADRLIEKAEAMLKFPLAETTTRDGKTMVRPGRWTFADAARMLEGANRLKQLATGLPTERLEHSGPDGTPMTVPAISVQNLEAVVFDQIRREVEFKQRAPKTGEETGTTHDESSGE
jgi:transposase-like protein